MKQEHILLVDDDARNIFALEANLKVRNYRVRSFTDIRVAIEWLKENEASVILLDMMMPEMDGYEAIGEIRGLAGRENAFIVAVTAQAMLGDRDRCIAAGADDYVAKPIDLDRLLGIIEKHME